eukprot:1157877-Pelagomonas_calceolata.AAC.11
MELESQIGVLRQKVEEAESQAHAAQQALQDAKAQASEEQARIALMPSAFWCACIVSYSPAFVRLCSSLTDCVVQGQLAWLTSESIEIAQDWLLRDAAEATKEHLQPYWEVVQCPPLKPLPHVFAGRAPKAAERGS